MTDYRNNADIIRMIQDIQKDVERLMRSNPLNNATIDSGGLVGKYESGNMGITFGALLRLQFAAYYNLLDESTRNFYDGYRGFQVLNDKTPINGQSSIFRAAYIPPGYSSLSPLGQSDVTIGDVNDSFQDFNTLDQFAASAAEIAMRTKGRVFQSVYGTTAFSPLLTQVYMDQTKMELFSGDRPMYMLLNATTSSAANARIDTSTRQVFISTSSARYKEDITLADLSEDATRLLEVTPLEWTDIYEKEHDPETENRYIGYTAEDLHNLGLTSYVDYDDKGKPLAIQYERLVIPLIELVKNLNERLLALEYPEED